MSRPVNKLVSFDFAHIDMADLLMVAESLNFTKIIHFEGTNIAAQLSRQIGADMPCPSIKIFAFVVASMLRTGTVTLSVDQVPDEWKHLIVEDEDSEEPQRGH